MMLDLPKRVHYAGLLDDSAEAKMVENYYKYAYIGEVSRLLGRIAYERHCKLRNIGDKIKELFK